MAVIQKIRDKYAKLAGFVIVLALLGFILMDASAGGGLNSLFGKGNHVASVNGEKIDYKDYAQRVQDYEVLYSLYGQGQKLDDNVRAQLRDQALNEMINEILLRDQLEDLGLAATEEEEQELIYGPNPDPIVRQFPYFADPNTGQFNPQYVRAFEKQVDGRTAEGRAMLDQWEVVKAYVKRNHQMQKYNMLVVNSVYVPKFMAQRQIDDMGLQAQIRFVKLPFALINDNEVPVTDAELNTYLKDHRAQYAIEEPTRSIEYVSFDVVPSADDSAQVTGSIQDLKNRFAEATDVEGFVTQNSETPYNPNFITRQALPAAFADSILATPTGAVYGPYYDNGAYHLTRITERRQVPDSASAEHILIAIQAGQPDTAAAWKLADSLRQAVASGASFDSLAVKYSEDQGSAMNGGDLGYFPYGAMVPEFNEAVFMGKKGDLTIVRTQFGYHVIRVLDQKSFQPAVRIAVVTKPLDASSPTDQAYYAQASSFAGRTKGQKNAFEELVRKEGLQKRTAANVRPNDFLIQGLGSSREIIRWMYNAKVGDVSDVFNVDGQGRYVVARLSDIQEKGLIKIDANTRPRIEALVRAEKKAKMLADKYKGQKSLEAIAQASGQVVAVDSFNAANPYAPVLGFEPKVIGYSFYKDLKPNTLSPAIQGNEAVYFISLLSRSNNPLPQGGPQAPQQRSMMEMQLKNNLSQMLQTSLRRNAEIKYNTEVL